MFDRPLNEKETDYFRQMIARRGKREPLQYIIGYTDFYNIRIKTDHRALIPRPETELLVDLIISQYKSKYKIKFLDIGIGTGCISISLLKNLEASLSVGIDISEDALNLCSENLIENKLEQQCKLILFNALEEDFKKLGTFDFIVSNPPYVSKNEFNNLEPELKCYEPRIALTDEDDGMKFYKIIINNSRDILVDGGKLFFEITPSIAEQVEKLFVQNNYRNINLVKDLSNHYRIIYGEKE
jgi:release factor glutamine methyltransferase